MIFFIILGGGLIGAFSALKSRIYSVWSFLICTLFSAYLAILAAPAFTQFLAGVGGVGQEYKNCAVIIAIFIILEIVFNKFAALVLGEDFSYYDFPAIQEKLGMFFCGFFSGMLILSLLVYCAVMVLPLKNMFKETEAKACITDAGSAACRIVTAGNVITWTAASSKQLKIVEAFLPAPEVKKPEDPKTTVKKKTRKRIKKTEAANTQKTEDMSSLTATETQKMEGMSSTAKTSKHVFRKKIKISENQESDQTQK